jgi:hypothetical protein
LDGFGTAGDPRAKYQNVIILENHRLFLYYAGAVEESTVHGSDILYRDGLYLISMHHRIKGERLTLSSGFSEISA